MKPWQGKFFLAVGLFVYATVLLRVAPAGAGNSNPQAAKQAVSFQQSVQALPAGNHCLSCHSSGDARLENATVWTGDIGRTAISPCPATIAIKEELFYTERLMLAMDRNLSALPATYNLGKTQDRITANREGYSRLLDTPTTSLEAFRSEAQMLRYQMGKSYATLNAAVDAVKRQQILIAGALVTLALLVSLGWGLYNTRVVKGSSRKRLGIGGYALRFVFVLLVFAFFALPIFRLPVVQPATVTAEQQAVNTVLDTSDRAAAAGNRALARSWSLARVAALWSASDPEKGGQALADAQTAAREASFNDSALWGEAQTSLEISAGSQVNLGRAGLVSAELQSVRRRAWNLRLMAEEWLPRDPQKAKDFLEQAIQAAQNGLNPYRDLDLRSIAVTYARLDVTRALEVARQVQDPALRAWGLREIAGMRADQNLYAEAGQAASQVQDALQRAAALRAVGLACGEKAYFEAARQALQAVAGEQQAYALSDLAAASNDRELALAVDPAYPAARTAALYRVGAFEEAWQSATTIADPYEQGRAQAAIAAQALDPNLARQIPIPLYRDLALREIALALKDRALAAGIASPYYRVQALTALGDLEGARQAAESLSEPYPLVKLAQAYAKTDLPLALDLMDKLNRETDKAEVLRTAAVQSGTDDLFEKALGMALAARVRNDELSPVDASLRLAQAFENRGDPQKAALAYQQAYDTALRISIK